ncbi:hypothetical protein ACEG43_44515 [Streptomyces aureus]|uniref:Uncharacterized protein n=1 Tax=Streptomyces aureus TaxID=193461 RepID=A0ABV4T0V5_9ACTN
MSIPARIAADLVLVQAALVLRSLEALLDGPAGAGDEDQVSGRAAGRRIGKVVGDLVRPLDAAACQNPPAVRGLVTVEEVDDRQLRGSPVEQARALGAITAGELLPGIVRCLADELVDAPDPGKLLDLR